MDCKTLIGMLIPSIMTLVAALSTTIINNRFQLKRDKNANIDARRMKVVEYQIQAYREIYSALLDYQDYFSLFVFRGNEYKRNEESENFGPLEENEKLRNVYKRNVLYFSDELRSKISSLLASGSTLNNLAIILCNGNADAIFEESLESSCEKIIVEVEECIKCIKKDLQLDYFFDE